MPKITTFLTYDNKAEEAARFYTSIFPRSKITKIVPYTDAGPGPKGTAMCIEFELDGREYVALNGGPHFKFTEAASLMVECETQEEVDSYWKKLSEGGEESVCGWLKDKFGFSWQIAPRILLEMIADRDGARASRVMAAMMRMKKIDIAELKKAYEG
jgi:predicted 3-demethylubiquinone-9 3-methyltransferase (glyoxalase superfamily)